MRQMSCPVYALNLFNISTRDEYLAYSRRSAREVARHGGRVLALEKFQHSVGDEVLPLILVAWESREAFEIYCNDALLQSERSRCPKPRVG